jgi:MoxR-like ATPase
MQKEIETLLSIYPSARAGSPFKGPHEVQGQFQSLQADIESIKEVEENPNLLVKYSYGKGNWAAVPWIAILDSRETTSTQDGTYIVILLSEEGSGCHLKLGQGVTAVKQSLGKRASEELRRRAEKVRSMFPEMRGSNFDLSGDPVFRANKGISKLYEASTIFSQHWMKGEIPSDQDIQLSLLQLVDVYIRYVDSQLTSDSEDETEEDDRRIWAVAAGEGGKLWKNWQEEGIISIGWPQLGDLTKYPDQDSITDLLEQLQAGNSRPYNNSLACHQFSKEMKPGDIVIAKAGRKRVLGMGIVSSDYLFREDLTDYNNQREVSWLRTDPTEFPGTGIALKALTELTAYQSCVDLVNNYLDIKSIRPSNEAEDSDDEDLAIYSIESIVSDGCFIEYDVLRSIIEILKRKRNLILQGPPGTGKTWLAKRLAYALVGKKDKARVRSVQFHPNLSYEDFVRGWRPAGDGKLSLVDGAFLEAIEDAKNSTHPHVIVIEEINRGNPAQIFGEMLTLLESDKREPAEALELSYRRYPDERVYIPPNLFVIGTMNVADRSLALVDMALRRRFAFFEMNPMFNDNWQAWLQNEIGFSPSFIAHILSKIEALNIAIAEDPGLGVHYCVGHSYLTPSVDQHVTDSDTWYRQVVDTELRPLISEYWFDDPNQVSKHIADLLG